MWIDGLCINQCDDGEKGQQVALMGKIFQQATTVVAWLGPKDDESNKVMDHLYEACENVEFDWQTQTLSSSRKSQNFRWADNSYGFPWDSRAVNNICSLLQQPYFERLWIVPEIRLVKELVFCYGHEKIAGDNFWAAIGCLYIKPIQETLLSSERMSDFIKAKCVVYDACPKLHRDGAYQYARLWNFMPNTNCTDPRDRIYAVASLLHPEDKKLNIQPDYTKRVEDVYIEVASLVISKRRNLGVLETCDLSSRALQIPTWVPDWSSRPSYGNAPFTTWSACAYISSQAVIQDDSMTCITPGIRATEVKSCTTFQFNRIVFYPEEMLETMRKLKPPVEELKCQYRTGGKRLEAYCQTFSCSRSSDTLIQSTSNLSNRTQAQLNSDLDLIWSTNKSFE